MKLGKVVGIAGVVVLSLGPVSQSSGQLGAVMGNMGNMGNLFQMAGDKLAWAKRILLSSIRARRVCNNCFAL